MYRSLTCVCCVTLPCCLFDLACFFLSSFSSLIKTCTCMYMYIISNPKANQTCITRQTHVSTCAYTFQGQRIHIWLPQILPESKEDIQKSLCTILYLSQFSRLGIQVSLAIICLFVWAMVGWVTLPFFSFFKLVCYALVFPCR